MNGKLVPFPGPRRSSRLSPEEGKRAAETVFSTPMEERAAKANELRLEDPELLLGVCEVLRSQLETSPAFAREEAQFFFTFLSKPERPIGFHDEREYFLGELALTVGTACRCLFRREEARRWFDRAETNFVLVENGVAHFARLAYQRLALAAEERRFDEVLELSAQWSKNFIELGMPEDALKCRFLEAVADWESGETKSALVLYREICEQAEELRSPRLVAQAASNLFYCYANLGKPDEAVAYFRKALPILQQLNSRVHLAKLQASVGDLFRAQGNFAAAIEAYRVALRESEELGIRGDVAAVHLILADVLLDAHQDRQAEWEIRAALPIIDEEKMVPEGMAALALLQESLRRRQIDRNALRELHGYFQKDRG